jgi:hypothetical protein
VEVVEADDTVAEEMAEEATGDETEEVADEMEDESEEMEESMDEEESEEATEDEESMDADDGAIEIAGCTDSDGGMNYDVAGDIVDVNGIEDSDYCSQNENYPGRLYENYCQDSGKYGRETYDCPSGSCVLGACVPVAE